MSRSFRSSRAGLSIPAAVLALSALACIPALVAQAQEPLDYDAIVKLKDEGFQRSQVMDLTSYLTDIYGPRLTGSPNYKAAADWALKRFAEWGLTNPHFELFEFGRGWSNERLVAQVVAPQSYPLIAYAKAWTAGTDGPVRADVVKGVVQDDQDMEKLKGKLKGKIVLSLPMREVKAIFDPLATRFSEKDLQEMQLAEPPRPAERPWEAMTQLAKKRAEFYAREGVVAVLEPSKIGDGGTVFVSRGGSRNPKDPVAPVQLVLAVEHYGRIWRTVEKNMPVTIELDVRNAFHDAETNSYNIVAEIPGTDPALSAEVVMMGGHFDSWHAGTGATDNAAGCAVMMEAARILTQTGLRMKRTVRVALWGGEEQGLLGSRAYVKQHFAERETMALKPEHAKLSAYYNVDNGTGAIRGVYLQGNDAVASIFRTWMEPFHSLGMTSLTTRNTGGTDHLSFDAVGLPGFQFIQDEMEYETRTHHSNMDVYERIQPFDMMKNAVIVASFVYHTANRDQMILRKPLQKPKPAEPARTPTPTGASSW